MSTTRLQEVLICFGKKKQADISTASTAADMWRFTCAVILFSRCFVTAATSWLSNFETPTSHNNLVSVVPPTALVSRSAQLTSVSRIKVWKRKLDLSPEQEDRIRELLIQAVEEEMKVKTVHSAEEAARLANAGKQREEQIRGVLSPEQQLAYDDFQQGNALANARVAASRDLLIMQSLLGLTPERQTRMFDALLHKEPLENVLSPSEIQIYSDYLQRHTWKPANPLL